MIKKSFLLLCSLLLTLFCGCNVAPLPVDQAAMVPPTLTLTEQKDYDIIIYGGGPQAVATALKATAVTQDAKRILMIVPEAKLGSIWTVGKQNIMDLVPHRPKELPHTLPSVYQYVQGGTFSQYLMTQSTYFSPDGMAHYLAGLLAQHRYIEVKTNTDITASDTVQVAENVYRVKGVALTNHTSVYAPLFVDASETGRLLERTHFVGTIGRQDQHPKDRTSQQMAATLMFEVRGVNVEDGYYYKDTSPLGSLQIWAKGRLNTPEINAWNAAHPTMRLKPFNAAEDGYAGLDKQDETTPFWMNMLLLYGVDATDPASCASARQAAMEEMKKPEFLQALRSIDGFEHLQLVEQNGEPVVGDELYVRESIHSADQVLGNQMTFALDRNGVLSGGESYAAHRIGVGYYQFDNNSYSKEETLHNPLAREPWYIPYEALRSPHLQNVLIPGYAANIDSFAWSAMRVYPNLTVLGDGAGVAAGLASENEFSILNPTDAQITHLQQELANLGAILEK